MITTTLNKIRDKFPCRKGWTKLLTGLGKTTPDDDLLPFSRIVKINGIDDALWCCCAEPQHACEWRLVAVWCARQVEHLMTDKRSRDAVDVAEHHANGEATDAELIAVEGAACDATNAYAANATAATGAAASAAASAAAASAANAAMNAARDAANAAAANVAGTTAWLATWDAARDAQTKKFLEIVGEDQ